jgi:hypothetical protein
VTAVPSVCLESHEVTRNARNMRHKRSMRERVSEWMLPPAERRAAKMERIVLERMRRERDWYCERSRQRLHDEVERNKWSAFIL